MTPFYEFLDICVLLFVEGISCLCNTTLVVQLLLARMFIWRRDRSSMGGLSDGQTDDLLAF